MGCSNSKEEFLIEENKELKAQLDSILNLHETLENRVILLPRSNFLKLGEEYEAELFMTTFQKEHPPYAEVYFSQGNNTDTITPFTTEGGRVNFRFTPTDTGHYRLYGNFRQELLGKTTEMKIPIDFIVQ